MKFNFKKISAALTSALMIASGVGFAAAAAFPAPFSDGTASGSAVVYGANAASTDQVAASNINEYLKKQVKSEGGTPTGGDFVKLEKASDKVNLLDDLATVFGATVDDEDLPILLADGLYSNDENTEYDFEQKLTLGGALETMFFSDSDYKDEALTYGINLSSDHVVLNYTLSFIDSPESDVSGGDLVDFETTNFNILGKNYFVLDADNGTNVKFTLLDSADSAIVSEGETKTMNVGGKSYDVSIEYVSTTEVKLKVNEQVTNSLAEGGTYKLDDGTYLGIKDILARDVAGTVGKVEFSIGSGKLELQNAQKVKLNDDSVEELTGWVTRGAMSGSKETITKIILEWKTDDEEFITADSALEMPGFKAVKFTMDAFKKPAMEVVKLKNSGSTKMELTATLKDGEVTIPILYTSSQDLAGIGESATKLVFTTNETTAAGQIYNDTVNDWMIVSWNSTKDHESYVLRFNSFSKTDGINYTTVQKLTEGGWEDACKDRSDSSGTATCDIGSLTLTLNQIRTEGSTTKYVNFSGNSGSSFNKLYTKEGLEIAMPFIGKENSTVDGSINFSATNRAGGVIGNNASRFTLVVKGEDKDGNLGIGASTKANVTVQTDADIEVSGVTSLAASQIFSDPTNDDDLVGVAVATTSGNVPIEFWRKGASSSQRSAEFVYYGDESYFTTYLTAPETTLGQAGGMLFKDTEEASWSGRNVVLVGGSCINAATAKVLGGAYCESEFTDSTNVQAGQFMIATYADKFSAGKVAVVVAGYDAADTSAAAANLLANPASYDTTAGKVYTGTVSAGGSVEVTSA